MKKKVILVLVLLAMIYGSLKVDTLSYYTDSSSFGISITPNLD